MSGARLAVGPRRAGVALSGRQLELSGSNSHTGGTWVHHGTLVLDHASAARSSGVTVATEGTLAVGGILEAGDKGRWWPDSCGGDSPIRPAGARAFGRNRQALDPRA